MPSESVVKLSFRELYVILVAGLGGLLYGVDIGVIAAALPYISDTVHMTLAQTSLVVAAVLAGSSISSVAAGVLADRIGRKGAVVTAAVMFVGSIIAIGMSHAYIPLLIGRLAQGMSGGIIAVVVPLYLAEELTAERRGRGTAIFQFSLTFGIVVAAVVGTYYTRHVEQLMVASIGQPAAALIAEDHAWRSMFFALLYPGGTFLLMSVFLRESRYWTKSQAQVAGSDRDHIQVVPSFSKEKETFVSRESPVGSDNAQRLRGNVNSLWQRKYVIPFSLACVVLACNQATGINSILSYAVLLFHEAGLSATRATQGDLLVKVVNCVFTLIAFTLIDRKGRKFLLVLGTSGIVLSLLSTGLLFRSIEGRSIDVKREVQAEIFAGSEIIQIDSVRRAIHLTDRDAYTLSVLYSYGGGEKIVSAGSSDPLTSIRVARTPDDPTTGSLAIVRAQLSPRPSPLFGAAVTGCLVLFIAFFAIGPGVVVWLTLSELMPTRIRSKGMGMALLLNQGVSTASAAAFLLVVGLMRTQPC